jgi:hypothetical protein
MKKRHGPEFDEQHSLFGFPAPSRSLISGRLHSLGDPLGFYYIT